ncbi:MAG: aldo/keto reductase [Gemmatimonadota bacterium]
MDRREFIGTAAAAGLAAAAPWGCATLAARRRSSQTVPRRPLGRTGLDLPVIGFAGLVVAGMEQARADRTVAAAFDRGVDYFDVAPTYRDAEDRLGPALEPFRRRSFLACKTTQRKAAGAEQELHASLAKLRTDHFDLYQLHALRTPEDIEQAFGPGGAMETFLRAKEEGKVRFLGFSAHSVEAALAAMERFAFDAILFPVNYVAWWRGDFGPQVVTEAQRQGMGILALKSLCRQPWPEGAQRHHDPCWYEPVIDRDEARLALSFTLDQGATAAIPPANEELFWLAVELAGGVRTLTAAEETRLRQLAAGFQPLFRYPAT